MTREEYEERRRAFEEQHRVDVALMNAAQEARIRSLDRVWQESLERERSASEIPRAPVQPAPSPAPAPRTLRPRYSVITDLEEAFPQLPQVFTRKDIVRALGYEPPRTTLFSALNRFQEDGAITIESYSGGGRTVRYRKLSS